MKRYSFAAMAAAALCATTLFAQNAPAPTPTVSAQPVAAPAAPASADGRNADTWLRDGDRIYFSYSPYVEHFRNNPEYVDRTHLVDLGIETKYDTVWGADRTLFGVSVFKNSYGQPSQYLYWGQKWDMKPWLYAKVTAGLLHGYKGKYKNNIPFNDLGVAPAIIPAIGVQYKDVRAEAIVLGFSALMFTVGYRF